jgi:hypothetical protein
MPCWTAQAQSPKPAPNSQLWIDDGIIGIRLLTTTKFPQRPLTIT